MFELQNKKKNFNKDGFIILRNFFLKNEIKSIIKEIKKIKIKSIKIKNPHLHYTEDKKINTIHNINKYINSGPIIKIAKSKKILNIVNYILNSKSKVRNIELFLKPKRTGLSTPYHQDNFYWNFLDKRKALNLWIACSDSSYKNGGVCYYKSSHKRGLLKHSISYAPGSSQKIDTKQLKKIKLKRFYPNLKLGDCLIHHPEVVHGSESNKSNKDRLGLVIGYKSTKAKVNKKKFTKYEKNLKKHISFLQKQKIKKNNIAIILARGGSKGIKNKNLYKVNKMPLVYWSIKSCLKANEISSVWVSSDDKKILKLSKKYKTNIIRRPKKFSGDYSSSEEAWRHALIYIKSKIKNIDAVVGIQPTSPIRPPKILDDALKKFYREKLDSLFTGEKISHNFVWQKSHGNYRANYNYKKRPMRQENKEKYLENGSFYIFNSEKFLKKKCRLFGKIGYFGMNKINSFQIDDYHNIELFSNLVRYF